MSGSILYGVKDMVVGVKTGPTTFAAMIDAPGIISFSAELELETEELFADDRVMASTGTRRNSMGSFELGVIDNVTSAALTGGESLTVGDVDYYLAPSGTSTPLVQLAALSRGAGPDLGSTVLRVYQARPNNGGGFELGQNYATRSFDYVALDFNGYYFQVEQHEDDLANISTTAVSTIPVEP